MGVMLQTHKVGPSMVPLLVIGPLGLSQPWNLRVSYRKVATHIVQKLLWWATIVCLSLCASHVRPQRRGVGIYGGTRFSRHRSTGRWLAVEMSIANSTLNLGMMMLLYHM